MHPMFHNIGLGLPVREFQVFLLESHHAFFYYSGTLLTLALLVTKVVANHHDATVTTNDFALVANLLHAWLYLHDIPSFFLKDLCYL